MKKCPVDGNLTLSISLTIAFRCLAEPYLRSFSTTLLVNFCQDMASNPLSTTISKTESRSEFLPNCNTC